MPLSTFHTEKSPEAELPFTHHAGAVSLAHQVEGPLLSLSQEELREKIHEGEKAMQRILETIGIPPEKYTAEMIAEWISVDQNALNTLTLDQLPEIEKQILASRLWGCVGAGDIEIPDREEARTLGTSNNQLLPASPLVNALREKIIFEPATGMKRHAREKLQAIALRAAWNENPTMAKEWIERLHAEGRDDLVKEALIGKLSPFDDEVYEKKRAIAKEFPWVINPQTLKEPKSESKTADVYLSELEGQEAAAKRYDAYKAAHPEDRRTGVRRRRLKPPDMWAEPNDEEQGDPNMPPYAKHSLERFESTTFDQRSFAFQNAEEAVAVCRFVEKHPEALIIPVKEYGRNPFDDGGKPATPEDMTAIVVLRVLGTMQRVPREEIPDEMLQFIAKHIHDPSVQRDYRVQREAPNLVGEDNPHEIIRKLRSSCFTKAERDTVRGKLPKECDEEWINYVFQDPRVLRAAGAYLSTRPMPYSVSELKAATADFVGHLDRIMEEQGFAPEEYERFMLVPEGNGGYLGGRSSVEQSIIPRITWILHQDRLSFVDSYTTFLEFQGHETLMNDTMDELLVRRSDATVEDLWAILDSEKHAGHRLQQNIRCITRHLPLFRKAFLQDIPRCTEWIANNVIAPLAINIRESGEHIPSYSLRELLAALETMALFDAKEAQMQMEALLREPVIGSMFRFQIEWHPKGIVAPFVRLTSPEIAFARPEQKNYARSIESGKLNMPHPIGWALDREAEQGSLWAPRLIPLMDPEAFTKRWATIVREGTYPPPPSGNGGNGKGGANEGEDQKERQQSMEEMRDQLLEDIDDPRESQGGMNPDSPELPSASLMSENPKQVGVLSEPLTGDARYILVKVCDTFDPEWLAHMPTTGSTNADLRAIFESDKSEGSKEVSLTMRVADNAVVPLPLGNTSVSSVTVPNGSVRHAGHWSRRITARAPVDATINYALGEGQEPGSQSLSEVRSHLPASLMASRNFAKPEDLPPFIRERISDVALDQPLREVVRQIQQIVHTYYEYNFIVDHPVYKEKYRDLLKGLPYINPTHNLYLEFIHSLREAEERVQGRGVCGQLATVLKAALESVEIPAYFAAGYCPSGTTITTNDGHAWLLVPHLDTTGKLFMKPVEATSGGTGGLDAVRASAKRITKKDGTIRPSTARNAPAREPVNAAVEKWREHFASCLSEDAGNLTSDDVLRVSRLVRKADALRNNQNAVPTEEQEVTSHELADALLPDHTLISPETRQNLAALETSEHLSSAAQHLIALLLSQGEAAYTRHINQLPNGGLFDGIEDEKGGGETT